MKRFAATRGARGVIKQARSDLKRGLEDTDRRGVPARPAPKRK